MKNWLWVVSAVAGLMLLPPLGIAQESKSPKGIESEQSLPSRYVYVVEDVLKYCQPPKGCWVDLGAGQGEVALALIEATGNPVVMLDPNREAMTKGLAAAREKHLEDRLFAVTGTAEAMPFLDNSVDLVVSRGSIFFWNDPIQGLKEVYRVLRPGGKAYIGGGAGSRYPASAVEKLIQQRKAQLLGEEAEKWQRFVELRRPEQMTKWAADAGLTHFEVMGKGAISAEDPRVGQGVWLVFGKIEADEHRTFNIERPTSNVGTEHRTFNIERPTSNRIEADERRSLKVRRRMTCHNPGTSEDPSSKMESMDRWWTSTWFSPTKYVWKSSTSRL